MQDAPKQQTPSTNWHLTLLYLIAFPDTRPLAVVSAPTAFAVAAFLSMFVVSPISGVVLLLPSFSCVLALLLVPPLRSSPTPCSRLCHLLSRESRLRSTVSGLCVCVCVCGGGVIYCVRGHRGCGGGGGRLRRSPHCLVCIGEKAWGFAAGAPPEIKLNRLQQVVPPIVKGIKATVDDERRGCSWLHRGGGIWCVWKVGVDRGHSVLSARGSKCVAVKGREGGSCLLLADNGGVGAG